MLQDEKLTRAIFGAFYQVYNTLGHGFLEKVHENALAIELQKRGLRVERPRQIRVYYDNCEVGFYIADVVVEGRVILEIKAVEVLNPAHEAQLVNYLRATEVEVGLLLNFGNEAKFVRKIFSNHRKRLRRIAEHTDEAD